MESNKPVPAFLTKLYSMVCEKDYDDAISWSGNGTSFLVQKVDKFASQCLPRYYKHNNFASFVRQCHMYHFTKVSSVVNETLGESHRWEFRHPHFIMGKPEMLRRIKRKTSSTPLSGTTAASGLPSNMSAIVRGGSGKMSGGGGGSDSMAGNGVTLDATAVQKELINMHQEQMRMSKLVKSLQSENAELRSMAEANQKQFQRVLTFLAAAHSREPRLQQAISDIAASDPSTNVPMPITPPPLQFQLSLPSSASMPQSSTAASVPFSPMNLGTPDPFSFLNMDTSFDLAPAASTTAGNSNASSAAVPTGSAASTDTNDMSLMTMNNDSDLYCEDDSDVVLAEGTADFVEEDFTYPSAVPAPSYGNNNNMTLARTPSTSVTSPTASNTMPTVSASTIVEIPRGAPLPSGAVRRGATTTRSVRKSASSSTPASTTPSASSSSSSSSSSLVLDRRRGLIVH